MSTLHAFPRPWGFIRRHLAGGYSIPRSYGMHVAVPQLVLGGLGAVLLPWLSTRAPARGVSICTLLLMTTSLLFWCWGAFGSWRSATRHARRGGHRFWAVATQALLVVGALRTVGALAGQAGGLGEHWQVAAGRQPGPDVTLEVRAGGRSVVLRGGLNDGTADALSKTLARLPLVDTLVLQSDGGWVREGRLVARIVAGRGLRTRVEGACSSACTIAFLAGRDRSVGPTGRLGFHAFRSVAAVEPAADVADARETYRRAGLPESFIDKVVATPASGIWFPTRRELLAAGIVTSVNGAAFIVADLE